MKKNIILLIISIVLFHKDFSAQLSGTAFLNGQPNHSGIKIKFLSNGGTAVTDSAITSSTGNFSINISGGSYTVKYSKSGYLDVNYNNGNPVILTNTVALISQTLNPGNQVFVNGNVSGSWTSNNTYIVNGNLVIPNGQTLTIQPGTNIRFNGSYSITANGIINAVGNSNSKILFTSNKPSPNPADWVGIFIKSNGSTIKQCIIDYGESGVWMNNCSATISENEIKNFTYIAIYGSNSASNVNNNWIHEYKTVYTSQGITWDGSATATIQCNKIHDGAGYGIRPYSSCLVLNNEIYNINDPQRGFAMDVGVGTPTIQNNYIHHCYYGIEIGSSITPIPNPLIINNTIINNTNIGIMFHNFYADGSIINNIITGNDMGIFQAPPGCQICSTVPTEISHNLVWNNTSANYYAGIQVIGIGQTVSTNSNGDAVDSYFNLSQDPLFSLQPVLNVTSPCLNAGKAMYSNNIGFTSTTTCSSGVNSIKDNERINVSVIIYPNPSNGNFNIQIDDVNTATDIEIFNSIGQKVFEKHYLQSKNTLDLTSLNKGMYFLTLKESGNVMTTKKIILE